MLKSVAIALLTSSLALNATPASAQTAQPPSSNDNGWEVSLYPVLVWIPFGIDIDVEVPPFEGGSGGSGSIVDGRFDGAFLGGISLEKARWRIDADIIWAAVGGDVERPLLTVDADLIYGHAMAGYEVANNFYVTGGVRRLAVDFDIKFGEQGTFSRKPGFWDPMVGVGWHRRGGFVDWHATFEAGGFGVGTDIDLGGGFRIDVKPVRFFGITGGYNFLHYKGTNETSRGDFTATQTLHGPVLGIGFYF